MTNPVIFQDITLSIGNVVTYAIIDDGNGNFTSMTKADYDAQQAKVTQPLQALPPQVTL